jgi:hypothetical protein
MANKYPDLQPLSEEVLLLEISRIAATQNIFNRAVERIGALLEREAFGKAFLVELPGSGESLLSTSHQIQDFLASIQLPYRSLYSVPLGNGGEDLGKLIVCFASPRFLGDAPRRVASYAAEQLSLLLARIRLAGHTNMLPKFDLQQRTA